MRDNRTRSFLQTSNPIVYPDKAKLITKEYQRASTVHADPWQVSCSWAQKLRNLVVLTRSLESWYNGTINLQGADLDFCRRKARSVHAFRSPSQSALPDSSFKIMTPRGHLYKLIGDNLIWLDQSLRQVRVLDIRSWTSRVFTPVARETIHGIRVSDELVVFTTLKGTVYVVRLDGQGPLKKFQTPRSTRRLPVTCRSRTVACAEMLEDGIVIYIWDYDTQHGRSFIVNNETHAHSDHHLGPLCASQMGVLLQPDTETIVLFLLDCPTLENLLSWPQMRFYRFTYAGECLNGAKHPLDGYNSRLEFGDASGMYLIPASHDGLFMLHGNAWRSSVQSAHTLCFDEKLHSFIDLEHLRLDPIGVHDQGNVVFWKDTFIEAGTKDHIVVHRGTTSDPRPVSDTAYDHRGRIESGTVDGKDLLINDRHIIRPYCDALYVYCYDHTVQLPGQDGTLDGVGPWTVIEPRFASVRECIESMHDN